MELQRDYENEKRIRNSKSLSEFTSSLYKKQIKLANDKYIDELHMEYLNSTDISFEDSLWVKDFVDFLKSKN